MDDGGASAAIASGGCRVLLAKTLALKVKFGQGAHHRADSGGKFG
jgi:hypothetical protein